MPVFLICETPVVCNSSPGVLVSTATGARTEIVPMEFFRQRNGGLSFDLAHTSVEAAEFCLENYPGNFHLEEVP